MKIQETHILGAAAGIMALAVTSPRTACQPVNLDKTSSMRAAKQKVI